MHKIGLNLKYVSIFLILGTTFTSQINGELAASNAMSLFLEPIKAQMKKIFLALIDGSKYKGFLKRFYPNPIYPFAYLYLGFFHNEKIAYGFIVALFLLALVAAIALHFFINTSKKDLDGLIFRWRAIMVIASCCFMIGLPILFPFITGSNTMYKDYPEFVSYCGKFFSRMCFLQHILLFGFFIIVPVISQLLTNFTQLKKKSRHS